MPPAELGLDGCFLPPWCFMVYPNCRDTVAPPRCYSSHAMGMVTLATEAHKGFRMGPRQTLGTPCRNCENLDFPVLLAGRMRKRSRLSKPYPSANASVYRENWLYAAPRAYLHGFTRAQHHAGSLASARCHAGMAVLLAGPRMTAASCRSNTRDHHTTLGMPRAVLDRP